jgi:hypothetical protein
LCILQISTKFAQHHRDDSGEQILGVRVGAWPNQADAQRSRSRDEQRSSATNKQQTNNAAPHIYSSIVCLIVIE